MSESSGDQLFSDAVEPQVPREGLPREYRMRADRHYVDQLAAPSSAEPVRWIQVGAIDGADSGASGRLRNLIESIRSLGILQPLIVRRQDPRYLVVAGRKRLFAAMTLRMPAVPCLVRDFTGEEAAAVADADNLRSTIDVAERPENSRLTDAIGAHLRSAQACADLCDRGTSLRSAAFNLLKAHTSRALQLLQTCTPIAAAAEAPSRRRPFVAVVADVIESFAEETRLSGVTIRLDIRNHVSAAGVNEQYVRTGLSGALIAVLPLVEEAARPVIAVSVYQDEDGKPTLEVSQTCAPISRHVADHFFDAENVIGRPGGYEAMLGAVAANALAKQHGGEARFETLALGSRLSIVLERSA